MRTNASLILYHFDEEAQHEVPFRFHRVHICGATKIGDLSHGRRRENSFIVRIPTNEYIPVSCGDRVSSEKFQTPLTVVGFSDNRCGSRFSRHIKLLVK